jgi:hypothetical protein
MPRGNVGVSVTF